MASNPTAPQRPAGGETLHWAWLNEREGYAPLDAVEGLAKRMRETLASGSSVALTIGHERIADYIIGLEKAAAALRAPAVQQEPAAWLCEWRYTNEQGGGPWQYDGLYRSEQEAKDLPRSRRNDDIEHRYRPLYAGPVERRCLTCGTDLRAKADAEGVMLDRLAIYCGPECDPAEDDGGRAAPAPVETPAPAGEPDGRWPNGLHGVLSAFRDSWLDNNKPAMCISAAAGAIHRLYGAAPSTPAQAASEVAR